MFLKGDVAIRAPLNHVWDFLIDPKQIGQRVPGLEKPEAVGPDKLVEAALDSKGMGQARLLHFNVAGHLGSGERGNHEAGAF